MNHVPVKWKPVKCKGKHGRLVPMGTPAIIDIRYRGTLLSRIITMPKKSPISFESAIRMVRDKQSEAFDAGQFGDEPGQYGWYDLHFIEWMTALGFHIELTGDEFESYAQSALVA